MPIDTTRTPSGTIAAVTPLTESEIALEIGKRFVAIFGKGQTPEEIQRRLERAQLLKGQAEVQCERVRQRKGEESVLAAQVYGKYRSVGGLSIEDAAEATRIEIENIRKAGGLEPKEDDGSGG